MSFKTKKWKIFTLIHLENEAIILLFVQQKPKHDQVAFLCSGVGVNALFWCRSLTGVTFTLIQYVCVLGLDNHPQSTPQTRSK